MVGPSVGRSLSSTLAAATAKKKGTDAAIAFRIRRRASVRACNAIVQTTPRLFSLWPRNCTQHQLGIQSINTPHKDVLHFPLKLAILIGDILHSSPIARDYLPILKCCQKLKQWQQTKENVFTIIFFFYFCFYCQYRHNVLYPCSP